MKGRSFRATFLVITKNTQNLMNRICVRKVLRVPRILRENTI